MFYFYFLEQHIWDIDVLVLVWNITSGTVFYFYFLEQHIWDIDVLLLVWNITSGTVLYLYFLGQHIWDSLRFSLVGTSHLGQVDLEQHTWDGNTFEWEQYIWDKIAK